MTDSLTPEQLQAIRARLKAATEKISQPNDGIPWAVDSDRDEFYFRTIIRDGNGSEVAVITTSTPADQFWQRRRMILGQFIAHAPTDIAALLDEVESWKKTASIVAEEVKAAVAEVERLRASCAASQRALVNITTRQAIGPGKGTG